MRRYHEIVYNTIDTTTGTTIALGLYSPDANAVIIVTDKGYLMKPAIYGANTIRAYAEARNLME